MNEIKKNGKVYTPPILASFVSRKLIEYYLRSKEKPAPPLNLKIIDPACGDGELLIAIWEVLEEYAQKIDATSSKKRKIDPIKTLFGIEIDKNAVRKTKINISKLNTTQLKKNEIKITQTNALFPYQKKNRIQGWKILFNKYQTQDGFDLLIANPPWGADTSSYNSMLSENSYKLFKGQFDTSDLFIELSLSIVKENGLIAFIISDSLFNKERTQLRKMLLESTEIKFIGRFGEKIFPNINRACAIIILQKKEKPRKNNLIDCLRLNPKVRKEILFGDLSFIEVDKILSHKIPQKRFLKNTNYIFNIDIKENEKKTVAIFNKSSLRFGDFLLSYRGIELSKKGNVCQCQHCSLWFPLPRKEESNCPHCNAKLIKAHLSISKIVSDRKKRGYKPLIVGESIQRYKTVFKLWIDTAKNGINYKDNSIYSGAKLIVRKTGVGINATIDRTNSFTNQVVYIFKNKQDEDKTIPLEFMLSLINSRAMYYFLVKNYGETEWRSHPYLTQTQILDLPIPNGQKINFFNNENITNIVNILKPYIKSKKGVSDKDDAIIEYSVAKLYGLTRSDYQQIYSTLESVEPLRPIQALKKISVDDIFG